MASMRRFASALVLTSAVAWAPAFALAQSNTEIPAVTTNVVPPLPVVAPVAPPQQPGLFFRLGVQRGASTLVEQYAGDYGIELGIGKFLRPTGLLGPKSSAAIELNYTLHNRRGTFDRLSGFFSERVMLAERYERSGLYAGYGLGLGITRLEGRNTNGTRFDENQTQAIGRLILGYQLNSRAAIEAGYTFTSRIASVNVDGFGISYVLRF
jgi:hypothetical protein